MGHAVYIVCIFQLFESCIDYMVLPLYGHAVFYSTGIRLMDSCIVCILLLLNFHCIVVRLLWVLYTCDKWLGSIAIEFQGQRTGVDCYQKGGSFKTSKNCWTDHFLHTLANFGISSHSFNTIGKKNGVSFFYLDFFTWLLAFVIIFLLTASSFISHHFRNL